VIKPTWRRHFRLPPLRQAQGRLFAKNAKDGAPIVLVMPARSKAWATSQNVVGFGWTNAAFLALLHALPPEMPANSLRNKPFEQTNSGTPSPPGPMESGTYTRDSTKIFGFKELIAKIFRTKDLASGTVVPGRYAQRVSYI
jgi:hypothetical protein